jgi:peroxiredoxin Q/BCP
VHDARSAKVTVGEPAPSISTVDWKGDRFALAGLKGRKNVVLALNRGFICPFCLKHMARLHESRDQIRQREAEVVIVGPDSPAAFRRHWENGGLEFVGLPDPERRILRRYGQEVRLMRLGRLPATVVIDREGVVRYVHYGGSMMDIPPVETLLEALDAANMAA